MDRSGEYSKGVAALLIILSLVLSGIVLLGADTGTQAQKASDKDSFGYFWMDNKDPDPKVEYNWINVRGTGTELAIYGSGGYDYIILPWNFPLYGNSYDTIYVGSRGLIWFNDIGYAPSDYSSYPSSSEPNPSIAAGFTYPYNDYNSYGGVHYLTGTDNIGKYVVIEWNTNSYSQTYELILWETGLVKMQFNNLGSNSGYSNGEYMSVGIENSDSTITMMYTTYGSADLNNGLAVEFAFGTMGFANFKLENGGGPDSHTAFAEYDDYEFSFDVIDSQGFNDISQVRLYFGPPSLGIYLKYEVSGGLPDWSVGGGGRYMIFNASRSIDDTSVVNQSAINVVAHVKFLFNIPLDGNISAYIWARGGTALPSIMEIEDAMYLDSRVALDGPVIVLNDRGESLENEAFTKESENLTFTGAKLVYNSTNMVYPPNSSFYYKITDDELIEYFDRNASGRDMDIWLLMPTLAIRKVFTIDLRYGDGSLFPAGKFMGEFPVLAFRVDDSIPLAPASLVVRADSFKDTQREYDNDDVLYITWSSVKDSGSGIAKYRIWTTYAPGEPDIPFVDARVTQFVWNGTAEGVFRIFVWAEDGVGHAGDWKEASITIDKKDVFFTEFSPDPLDVPWLRTLTPDLSIDVKDNLTVSNSATGVRPSTVEYSVSTSGIDNFEEWVSADLFDVQPVVPTETIKVDLKPRFVEGRENYIRFRAKDYAGNGYSFSETYNLKIDVTPVEVQDFFPNPNVWHDQEVISNRDIECFLHDETSGIRTNALYYRIGTGYDASTDTYTWATGIPQQQGWEKMPARYYERIDGNKLVHVMIPYDGYQEGDQNFIQLMFGDEARNGNYLAYFGEMMTVSPLYQIYVNTQPVAMIKSPTPLQKFWITEWVTFDASDSYDIDVDEGNLKYQWFCVELNKTLGYDMIVENVMFPVEGYYNITLYVGDSVHRYDPVSGEDTRSVAKVRILIAIYEIPDDQDIEPDGMLDRWEQANFLTIGYDDSDEDADGDGWTNLMEYNKGTDPQDKASHPPPPPVPPSDITDEAPFGFWLFVAIVVAAMIIGAIVVLIGYLRIHRFEQQEQTEEAEEEAMLATPQLDIPAMPPMPMVDTSVPTLPSSEQPDAEALPPAQEAAPPLTEPAPAEGYQEPPVPDTAPQPVPEQVPQPDNPMYQQETAETQNPLYDGQQ
ncbi:MAG: hypothetical protein ACMUHY_09250 [Thermoplasmatota archaeon]